MFQPIPAAISDRGMTGYIQHVNKRGDGKAAPQLVREVATASVSKT